jgi:hypothetical protein
MADGHEDRGDDAAERIRAEWALPSPPASFRWHVESAYSYAIMLPRRFHLLGDTFDRVARAQRRYGNGYDAWEGLREEPTSPQGFCDSELFDERPDGSLLPSRLLEFDLVNMRVDSLPPDARRQIWFESRSACPETLCDHYLPSYRLLDIRELRVGDVDALGFEYHWDGFCPGRNGGDHGLFVPVCAGRFLYYIYHHCPENQWAARKPELDQILGSFRVVAGPDSEIVE